MDSSWPTGYDVALTTLRWIGGMSFGLLAGVTLACIEYQLRHIRVVSRPVGDFLRSVPVIAILPLAHFQFGASEAGKMLLIGWAVTFPVWVSVRQSLATRLVDVELLLAAAQVDAARFWWSYSLPRAAAGILRGLEISLGIGWIVTVAAEWLGTYSTGFWSGGLGDRLDDAQMQTNWQAMIVIIAIFGALGWLSALLFSCTMWLIRRLAPGFDPLAGLTQN